MIAGIALVIRVNLSYYSCSPLVGLAATAVALALTGWAFVYIRRLPDVEDARFRHQNTQPELTVALLVAFILVLVVLTVIGPHGFGRRV